LGLGHYKSLGYLKENKIEKGVNKIENMVNRKYELGHYEEG
jgi:hypothetical protein